MLCRLRSRSWSGREPWGREPRYVPSICVRVDGQSCRGYLSYAAHNKVLLPYVIRYCGAPPAASDVRTNLVRGLIGPCALAVRAPRSRSLVGIIGEMNRNNLKKLSTTVVKLKIAPALCVSLCLKSFGLCALAPVPRPYDISVWKACLRCGRRC